MSENDAADHNLYDSDDYAGGFFKMRPPTGPLKTRFTYPPYSTWDTRQGEWMERRRLWLAKGIKSEEGRKGKLTFNIPMVLKDGRTGNRIKSQTSIFDPVLCELVYGWWCRPGGVVIDPFAGGSVRGVVASVLGLKYWGCELREEQVVANRAQVNPATRGEFCPKWCCGDSHEELTHAPAADLIFSCPPYGNLEKYSDDPADISSYSYTQFLSKYTAILDRAVARLRPDRFAVYVVGNYRDRDAGGRMRDLVGDTVRRAAGVGLQLYNEIILINSVGTGAMRSNTSFVRGARKVVKMHQNILVFIKGDARRAAELIPADAGVNTGEGNNETPQNEEADQEAAM